MAKQALAELANISLNKWTVRKVFEVYMTDSGGMGQRVKSIGWFFDRLLAEAFKDQQVDAAFCSLGESWALVDPDLTCGFLFQHKEAEFEFMNEFEVRKGVRANALKKLTPAERRAVTGTE